MFTHIITKAFGQQINLKTVLIWCWDFLLTHQIPRCENNEIRSVIIESYYVMCTHIIIMYQRLIVIVCFETIFMHTVCRILHTYTICKMSFAFLISLSFLNKVCIFYSFVYVSVKWYFSVSARLSEDCGCKRPGLVKWHREGITPVSATVSSNGNTLTRK